jgi:hypothetical protein
MTPETDDIYASIAQVVTDSIKEEWTKAVLRIKCLPKSKGYRGHYFDSVGDKKQLEPRPPFELDDALNEFHALTTEGGNNRWNYLYFTLYPNHQFEVDFIWDEDLAEEMAYINSTRDVAEPRRSAGLDGLKTNQLERKTARIYDAIARSLLGNAPEDEWQKLVLRITQPPLQYAAEVERAPGQRAALLLLGEEAALAALEELTQEGNHLRWEKVHVFVEPSGKYRFSFEWAGASEYNLPELYHREGQVSLGSALS